jgi:hypothetical protein
MSWEPALPISVFEVVREAVLAFALKKLEICGDPVDHKRGEVCGATFWQAEGAPPRNAIEFGVLALRNSAAVSSKLAGHAVAGCEWWVQYRPTPTIGMGLHLDADVGLFESERNAEGQFSGPLTTAFISSVTYITSRGGPTLVLDQYFEDNTTPVPVEPTEGELIYPRENVLVMFNGEDK